MLYAAAITKMRGRQRPTPWLIVNHEAFERGQRNKPFVFVKSDLRKIRIGVSSILSSEHTRTSGTILVWADGQGTREIRVRDIDEIQIVQLDVRPLTGGAKLTKVGNELVWDQDFQHLVTHTVSLENISTGERNASQ